MTWRADKRGETAAAQLEDLITAMLIATDRVMPHKIQTAKHTVLTVDVNSEPSLEVGILETRLRLLCTQVKPARIGNSIS